jgi:ElaA protein
VEALAPGADVVIGAQQRLERFYEEFDFRRVVGAEPYVEDGILHVTMRRARR